jgi:hypothetical protein
MIPQAKLGADLKTEVTDGITSLTAFGAMVGSPHRTQIEHCTRSAGNAVEVGMGGN